MSAAGGDEREFAAIYRRYHQGLYRFCLAIVGNSHDAQDALQNTMVKAMRALPGERRRIELKPWLYRVAHNESVELLRKRRPAEELSPELADAGPGLAEEAETRERLRRLIADLGRLPERQRGALVMRELAGLDFAEIAAALGTSPAVVRQTLYEARLSLRRMDEGREMSCATVTRALSDGDGRIARRRDIRAHLRGCPDCRRFREELEGRRRDFAAISPLPAAAAAALLHGLLGGASGSAAGDGMAGALGGGAAKSVGAATAIKSAAAVAVIAAVGVTAADRGGLIDVGPLHGGSSGRAGSHRLPGAFEPTMPGARAARAAARGLAPGMAAALPGAARAIGAARSAKVAAGSGQGGPHVAAGANEGPAPGASAGSASARGPSLAHPHGHGHVKQHPAASAYGQQTATSHKSADHGRGPAQGHRSHAHSPAHANPPAGTGAAKAPASPKEPGAPQPVSPDKQASPPLEEQETQSGAPGTGRPESKEER